MLINVGRGTVVDSEALADALRSGHLGGAGLDVTDPEPCPDDSPLWSLANVIITPRTWRVKRRGGRTRSHAWSIAISSGSWPAARWNTNRPEVAPTMTQTHGAWNDWRTYPPRPAWVEVDTGAIEHNTRSVCRMAQPATVMAVVKADGFGHGLVETARAALAGGATHLGVAIPEEGIALRRAGMSAPVLVMGTIPPRLADVVVEHDLAVALCTRELAEALDAAAAASGRAARTHVKVDTGVHRIGLPPGDVVSFMKAMQRLPGVLVDGIFSVLVDDVSTTPFARRQYDTFVGLLDSLAASGLRPPLAHLCNSVPLAAHPDMALDMVRTARLLFGVTPWRPALAADLELRPALSIRCEVCS